LVIYSRMFVLRIKLHISLEKYGVKKEK